jgi:opacity protein-like surface antigen
MKGRGFLAGIAVGAALLAPGLGHAAHIVLPQPGDIGFAAFAQYGAFTKTGEIGESFGTGAGYGLRLRYRMRYERALGLTFERQGFDPRTKSVADTAASSMTLTATGIDIYQMFGTRTRVSRMLNAGVGLAQITQKLNDKEAQVAGPGVGDGFYVSLGGGIEYFVWQSWAVDVSMRYHAVILHDTTNHEMQFYLGAVFYAAD